MKIPAQSKWWIVVGVIWAAGCGREAPPKIQEYVPLRTAKAPATQPVEPEEVAETPVEGVPAVEAAAPPPAMAVAPPVATEVEKAPVAAAPAGDKAPTIVGTWRVAEMSRGGRSEPMPPGMTMMFTFGEDGTFSISMAGMPEGAGGDMPKGSYTLNGDQISISAQGESKTGKLSFEGNDRATIDIDEGKMTLVRNCGEEAWK